MVPHLSLRSRHGPWLRTHACCPHRWISGAGDPRCAVHLVLGKSDPNNSDRYHQQSIVLVPANTPGVKVVRPMKVMGYDDAPEGHCEIVYDNVRVPLSNLILGWGKGFEVSVHCVVLGAPAQRRCIDHSGKAWVRFSAAGQSSFV